MNENQNTALTCAPENRYTVRAGDTFASVAQAYGITPGELTELNPYISPNLLIEGQVICVPAKPEATAPAEATALDEAAAAAVSQDRCPEGWQSLSVERGESYADLLVRGDISYRAMRIANPSLLPGRLRVGEAYCVPPREAQADCLPTSRRYTLAAGEDLAAVAQKFHMTRGRLLRLNPSLAPGEFVEGQVICLGQASPEPMR